MQRNIDINEISDGKKYSSSDMAKIACNDCEGCSKCCENMGGLITLDPYDIYRMSEGIENASFDTLYNTRVELTVDRGVLIPTLSMDVVTGKCTFLNENGRCSIHVVRPGICRLFPLGRLYEDDSFYYFLQKDECDYKVKNKIKIKNWLDTKELQKYEKYISDWHYFLMDIREYMAGASDEEISQINSALLNIFFRSPYENEFYEEFYKRLDKVRQLF